MGGWISGNSELWRPGARERCGRVIDLLHLDQPISAGLSDRDRRWWREGSSRQGRMFRCAWAQARLSTAAHAHGGGSILAVPVEKKKVDDSPRDAGRCYQVSGCKGQGQRILWAIRRLCPPVVVIKIPCETLHDTRSGHSAQSVWVAVKGSPRVGGESRMSISRRGAVWVLSEGERRLDCDGWIVRATLDGLRFCGEGYRGVRGGCRRYDRFWCIKGTGVQRLPTEKRNPVTYADRVARPRGRRHSSRRQASAFGGCGRYRGLGSPVLGHLEVAHCRCSDRGMG